MGQIDQFLDDLLVDYSALYKENAALKAKMRVLVDKIEEYRSVDEEMRKALFTAQVTARDIVEKAQKEADGLLQGARSDAQKHEGKHGRDRRRRAPEQPPPQRRPAGTAQRPSRRAQQQQPGAQRRPQQRRPQGQSAVRGHRRQQQHHPGNDLCLRAKTVNPSVHSVSPSFWF